MTDLTILAPQPLITLSFSSDPGVSKTHADHTSRGPLSNHPASSFSSPHSNDQQFDSSLLSPPLRSYRAPRKVRRTRSKGKSCSPNEENSHQSEDEENATDVSEEEDELDTAQFQGPSYTRSFRPFSYPSTPHITQVASHFQGDLRRPAPPLFRPKTFWRHTRRSALTGPSYSPSSYIVRRSTFIAAGLSLDKPHADLSALGVELRIGTISLVPSSALPL